MAKSTRSNCKKQLRTWRREKLVAKWQSDADAKRYAALQAIAEQPKPEPAPKATSDDDVAMAEQRGRSGKAAKEKDVNMATDAQVRGCSCLGACAMHAQRMPLCMACTGDPTNLDDGVLAHGGTCLLNSLYHRCTACPIKMAHLSTT